MPQAHEEAEPSFEHTPAEAIPELVAQGADVRVMPGKPSGVREPETGTTPV